MVKKVCDVCETEVFEFHGYGGNISEFGFSECCDKCWSFFDSSTEDLTKFDERAVVARQKFIEGIIKNAREAK